MALITTRSAYRKPQNSFALRENGASEEVRTLDIHLGKVVLYQLSYARLKIGKTVYSMGVVNSLFRSFRKDHPAPQRNHILGLVP